MMINQQTRNTHPMRRAPLTPVPAIPKGARVELKSCRTISRSLWGLKGEVTAILPTTDATVTFDTSIQLEDCNFKKLTLKQSQLNSI
jgi:hypothetical protein